MMIDFFPVKHDIRFMSYARITTIISLVTFLLAVFFLLTRGLHFGVEFTGGTVIEVAYSGPADPARVRDVLGQAGMPDAEPQTFGTASDIVIKLPANPSLSAAQQSEQVLAALRQADRSVQLKRVEFIGPQVGDELVRGGLIAITFVCLGIIAYLAFRFEWRFAVAAVVANMHDVVIILGCFAFFQWEFTLPVLAAVLSVLGYSVNESVVVFDRVRENFRKTKQATVKEVIDNAITRTMSRTIMTHLSTQLMVTSILFFGGEVLHNFALALTIGILFGIYSSVLVASPIAMWLGVRRETYSRA